MSYTAKIRLFIPIPLCQNKHITLSSEHAHYLKNVMRLTLTDQITLFNGRDGEWIGELSILDKKNAEVIITEQKRPQIPEPDIWLLFAPVKNVRIDFIAQKATELGVSKLCPIITTRTVVSRVNTERLRKNTIEAAEQCERLEIPDVTEPIKLTKLLGEWDENRQILFCDESRSAKMISKAFKDDKAKLWAILIGPEGGFSDEEIAILHTKPYITPASLGPRILRSDTAALSALTCWQAYIGDWRG